MGRDSRRRRRRSHTRSGRREKYRGSHLVRARALCPSVPFVPALSAKHPSTTASVRPPERLGYWTGTDPSTLPSLAQPHPTSRLYQRGLNRKRGRLQAVLEGGVLGAFQPAVSSPFNAAISPTSPVRSRAMSLVTSFGLAFPFLPARDSSVAKSRPLIQGIFQHLQGTEYSLGVAVCLYLSLRVLAIYLPVLPEVVEGFMGDDPHQSFILVS